MNTLNTHLCARIARGAAMCAVALGVAAFGMVASGCAQRVPGEAFDTPQAATDAMVGALKQNDTAQLQRILGSDANAVISSGDPVADTRAREQFLSEYAAKHQLVPEEGGDAMTLEVGPSAWPMPIPIVKDADGWRFDTEAGLDELLNRRIGRNEMDTIETCRAVCDAQREYFAANPRKAPMPEYAQKFISSPDTRDGLYWPTHDGEPQSPLGELVGDAVEQGYGGGGTTKPFHGYYYKLLTAQGKFAPGGAANYLTDGRLTKGFAIVAYPAQYGNSGVMTFIMNQQGIVYQRDLGSSTEQRALAMKEFNPDEGWALSD